MSKLSDDQKSIFLNELREAIGNGDFIRMVLGKPKETDAKKVIIKSFESKGVMKFSSDFRYAQKSISKSSELEGLIEFLNDNLGMTYLAATLFTNKADISFLVNKKGKHRLTPVSYTHLTLPTTPYV